jgi:hypothetical protein
MSPEPTPEPLTGEEERLLRFSRSIGGAPIDYGPTTAVDRLLATLDRERSDLDGAKRLNTDLLATLPIEDASKPVPATGPKRSFIGYDTARPPTAKGPVVGWRYAAALRALHVAGLTWEEQPDGVRKAIADAAALEEQKP